MRSHRLRNCYQIAVIGGNGFIGRAIIARLSVYPNLRIFSIDKRHNDVWIDTSKSRAIVQQIHMDVSTPGSIQTWLSGSHVDVVIFAAGYENPPIGVWDSSLEDIQSIEGLNYSLRGLKHLNISKTEDRPYFMYISSWTVYGDYIKDRPLTEEDREFPSNNVGMVKLLGEDLVKRLCTKFSWPWAIVRPTEVFGKRHNKELGKTSYWPGYVPYLVDCVVRRNKEITLWNTRNIIDLVHVDYVSKCIVYLLENRLEGIYNIASGERVSVLDIFNSISDSYGKDCATQSIVDSSVEIEDMNILPTKMQTMLPYDPKKYDLNKFLSAYIPVRKYEIAKNMAIEDALLEPLTLDTTTLGAKEAFEARKQRRRLSYSKIKEIAGDEFFKLKIGSIQTRAKELLNIEQTEEQKRLGEEKQKQLEELNALIEDTDTEFVIKEQDTKKPAKKRGRKKKK